MPVSLLQTALNIAASEIATCVPGVWPHLTLLVHLPMRKSGLKLTSKDHHDIVYRASGLLGGGFRINTLHPKSSPALNCWFETHIKLLVQLLIP